MAVLIVSRVANGSKAQVFDAYRDDMTMVMERQELDDSNMLWCQFYKVRRGAEYIIRSTYHDGSTRSHLIRIDSERVNFPCLLHGEEEPRIMHVPAGRRAIEL